jgi:sec-independent protein translocase protein TatC
MTEQQDKTNNEEEMGFISHLLELRDRLLRMVLGIIAIFLAIFYFSNDLYSYVAGPLMKHMPEGSQMIAIDVASPFLTPFKLSLMASIFLAMPYILYQLWGFIAPGLYQHERRMAAPLVVASSVLFYLGMAFAYYVVFPLVFGFLTGAAPEGVSVMTDISRYLDFVITLFFAFGAAFQVPIATILLVWSGATTPDDLVAKRPYIIVGAFVIGMILTPPDIISQTLLAIPMWILFEAGVIFARLYVPARNEEKEDEDYSIAGAGVAAAGAASTVDQSSMAAEEDDEEEGYTSGNESGHQEYDPANDDGFTPLTEEEMDEEIDRIEAEMDAMEDEDDETPDPGQKKKDSDDKA